MIGVPGNVRVYLACGVTDMRKGFDGLAARVQTVLQLDPHGGALFVFRGRRGDLLKVLWWDVCRCNERLRTQGHLKAAELLEQDRVWLNRCEGFPRAGISDSCVDGPRWARALEGALTIGSGTFMCPACCARHQAAGHDGVGGTGPHQAVALDAR